MAKYKEIPIVGAEWTQPGKIVISFHPVKSPTVRINEEQFKVINGTPYASNKREFQFDLTDKSTTFLIYDPDTGQPTGGDSTYRQLEKLLFSLYYTEALKADAEEINNAQ